MTVRIGAVAQLGERDTGSVEVRGSSPLSSTKIQKPTNQTTYYDQRRRRRVVGPTIREPAVVQVGKVRPELAPEPRR